jgi:hypothetical protein
MQYLSAQVSTHTYAIATGPIKSKDLSQSPLMNPCKKKFNLIVILSTNFWDSQLPPWRVADTYYVQYCTVT